MYKKKLQKYNLPDGPGVYTFLNAKKEKIYIGKATNLKSRIGSYFSGQLMQNRGPLLVKMIEEAVAIQWEQTESVLEALIIEANQIKKYQPLYNSKEKSNKSFNYLVITKEEYPRILIKRGRDLIKENILQEVGFKKVTTEKKDIMEKTTQTTKRKNTLNNTVYKKIFGPFPYGTALFQALKVVRKIFPYRDKCKIFDESAGGLVSGCFNYQINLCPGVCNGKIDAKSYAKIIRNIILLFEGKKSKLIARLNTEMRKYAKKEEFEKAAKIRNQIFSLEHIRDVAISDGKESINMYNTLRRIEAYDVAHMGEKNKVGVMIVIEDGVPVKSEYKRFKIRTNEQGDVPALRELLTRRLRHMDKNNEDYWELPNLIVVDGGKAQVNAVRNILKDIGTTESDLSINEIGVVGVVKDNKHNPKAILGDEVIGEIHKQEILLANSESHRVAINYHRNLRVRNFL